MAKIIKFYSPTCGPCRVLEDNLNRLNIEHTSINVMEADEEILFKYEIGSIPVLVVVDDNGDIIKKHIGLLPLKNLKEFCNGID